LTARICHLSTVHPITDVRVFHRECLSLAEAGYDVHLVIPCDQEGKVRGVTVHPLPRMPHRLSRMTVLPWLALVRALRVKAALYHYHDPELILIGFLLRWVFRKRVVFDIHESVPRQVMSKHWLPPRFRPWIARLYKIIEDIFIRGQTIVLASQHSIRDYPRSAYLVRNFPRVSKQGADAIEQPPERRRPLLIYVGAVSLNRGADILVDLGLRLLQRGHDLDLWIVGNDVDGCSVALQNRIAQAGREDHVRFLGHRPHEEAMRLVAQARLGLCLLKPVPNYTASLATKILEYMMVGTPVLASDFSCWRPFVQGTGAGRMVDPEDRDQVVNVCEAMLSDPEGLTQMGHAGRRAVLERFNWDSEFDVLHRCYRTLLNEEEPPA